MAYASYLIWALKKLFTPNFEPEEVRNIGSAIGAMLAQKSWYDSERYVKIQASINQWLANPTAGRHFEAFVPSVDIVEGANAAGCELQHRESMDWILYVAAMPKVMRESIMEMFGPK